MIPVMIIPVLCHYDKLLNMLKTIDFKINHLIIIDNGGDLDGLQCEYINRISIVNMPNNIGVPTAWNLGIFLEPHVDYWVFSQDDIKWRPGGLEHIANNSTIDRLCIGKNCARPFSTFSVGANVFIKAGIFDETYFPLMGDDFSFYRRCMNKNIEVRDITESYLAEKSASIRELLEGGTTLPSVFVDNMRRSLECDLNKPAQWNLALRRKQGAANNKKESIDNILKTLDSDFDIDKFFS